MEGLKIFKPYSNIVRFKYLVLQNISKVKGMARKQSKKKLEAKTMLRKPKENQKEATPQNQQCLIQTRLRALFDLTI
jgi:hypothetical protein